MGNIHSLTHSLRVYRHKIVEILEEPTYTVAGGNEMRL